MQTVTVDVFVSECLALIDEMEATREVIITKTADRLRGWSRLKRDCFLSRTIQKLRKCSS